MYKVSVILNLFQDRSVFYRRNTQKKEEKTELLKSPTYDLGEAKSPGWFLR